VGQKETLLRAVAAEPDELAARLAYADWLEEYGQSESDHARGEFIRLQCRMAEMDEWSPERLDLVQREQELLIDHEETWRQELPFWARKLPCEFRRGFVTLIETTPARLSRGAEALILVTPLEGGRLTDGTVEEVLACPHLERLVHLDLLSLKGGLPADWTRLEHIRRLRPPSGRQGREWIQALIRSGHLPHLTHLNHTFTRSTLDDLRGLLCSEERTALTSLGSSGFDDSGFSDLWDGESGDANAARALASSPALGRLRALDLRWLVNDETLGILATSPHLSGLQELRLKGKQISAAGIRALADSPGLAGLRSLEIESSPLGPAGGAALAASRHLAGLTRLSFWSCGLGDEGVVALTRSPFLHQLRVLTFDFEALTSQGIAALASCPALAQLTRLRVNFTRLGSAAAQALADSRYLGRLHTLELAGAWVSDQGLQALASSSNLPNLRRLHLYDCGIGPVGVEALASSPQRVGLRALRLHDNDIRNQGRLALVNSPQLTNLRELWISGADRHTRPALRERFGAGVRF
jgi:uncharacterized protein (TIGR02996 family)